MTMEEYRKIQGTPLIKAVDQESCQKRVQRFCVQRQDKVRILWQEDEDKQGG